jgi:branched-chain amino acid transport system permease protein
MSAAGGDTGADGTDDAGGAGGSGGFRSSLRRAVEPDIVKILAVFIGLYLLYALIGTVLGYQLRGQLLAFARLTFVIGIFAMLALTLNLQWGYTGLFNIGVAGFMAVGVYTMAMVSMPTTAGATRAPGLGLPIWVGIIAGMAAAALLGLIVALPAIRLRADYLAIVTIAFSEIVRFTYLSGQFETFTLFGREIGTGGGQGLIFGFEKQPLEALLSVFNLYDAYLGVIDFSDGFIDANPKPVIDLLAYGVVLLLVTAAFYWLLKRTGESPFGRVLKAIREDETVASALGKNTSRFKIVSFMLGCSLMGLGGILWLLSRGTVTPNFFKPIITFYVWIALIIGGSGSNTGSVLGGAIFAAVLYDGPRYVATVLNTTITAGPAPTSFGEAVSPLITSFDPAPLGLYALGNIGTVRLIIMGVALVWLMQHRPEGLLGHRKETAAAIDLSRPERVDTGDRPAAADGGTTDE